MKKLLMAAFLLFGFAVISQAQTPEKIKTKNGVVKTKTSDGKTKENKVTGETKKKEADLKTKNSTDLGKVTGEGKMKPTVMTTKTKTNDSKSKEVKTLALTSAMATKPAATPTTVKKVKKEGTQVKEVKTKPKS
jgi:archaellum component FlaF (FlaF/FlaG flagellin family)